MRFGTPSWIRCSALLLAVVCSLPCFAGEVAVLRNGFSIRHEKRVILGEITRLLVSADGSSYVDVPTADIEHFEQAPAEISIAASAPATRLPAAASPKVDKGDPKPVDLNEVVNSASGKYRLDPDLVNSVIKAESGFNAGAVSRKGAQGLMQLMPGTASQLRVPNPFDPRANVDGGTRYLRELLERYNFDLIKALAAYNAGPLRVEQYGGVPPYYETRAYVARIVKDFNKKKEAAQKAVMAKNRAPAPKTARAKKKPSRAQVAAGGGRAGNTQEQTKASTALARE